MKKLTFFLILLSHAVLSLSQYTYQVSDMSDLTLASEPTNFVSSGSYTFFIAKTEELGFELWRTDGTEAGTINLTDIGAGPIDGLKDGSEVASLIDVNGVLFFTAINTSNQPELWKSDGTPGGTSLVYTFTSTYDLEQLMTVYNGELLFFPRPYELWKSDGTNGGTLLVKDQLMTAGNLPEQSFVEFNGEVFFIGWDDINGYELWKTDGTTGGTTLFKDLNPGTSNGFLTGPSSFPASFKVINGSLYFAANDDVNGTELWTSNGTPAGTNMLIDINPTGNSEPSGFTEYNGLIYFAANDGVVFKELWSTDGTALGTSLFMDIYPGNYQSIPSDFEIFNGELFFLAGTDCAQLGHPSLMKTDGTVPGTQIVMCGMVQEKLTINGEMYVSIIDTTNMPGNWTLRKSTVTPYVYDTIITENSIINLTELNGELIFSAKGYIFDDEPWISDGTVGGTVLLKNINDQQESYLDNLAAVNSTLYFGGADNQHGIELWKSNGHQTNTSMVIDSNPLGNHIPYHLTEYNYDLYYYNYGKLTTTDGTAAGTVMVTDTVTNVGNFKVIDGDLFLTDSYQHLWRYQESDSSMEMLLQYFNTEYEKVGNYIVSNSDVGFGLRSVDLNVGITSEVTLDNYDFVYNMVNYHDTLYFVGFQSFPLFFNGLVMTDGTLSGTSQLSGSFSPTDHIVFNDTIFFAGTYGGITGIHYSTSPSNSINLLKEVYFGGNCQCSNFEIADDKLFFTGTDGINGIELWVTDGTSSGTVMVDNINPSGDSNPHDFDSKDGTIYFVADNGVNGNEVWSSDGTVPGTTMLADINPIEGSDPEQLTIAGYNLFFIADDGTTGPELWVHGIKTTANCYAHYETTYDSLNNDFILTVHPNSSAVAIGYFWDFGDGNTSTLAAPTHTYAVDSVYNVCMTVYDNLGDSCKFCQFLGKDSLGQIVKSTGFTIQVINNGNNAIEEEIEEDNILLYPNPTNDFINIQINSIETSDVVRIINMDGKIIQQFSNLKADEITPVDVSNFSKGVYIIEVIQDSGALKQLFVVN